MSLSLRRFGRTGAMIALFMAFIVVGIWHGANWTYVTFGILQGVFLALEVISGSTRKRLTQKLPHWLVNGMGIAVTFSLVTISLVFFRAPSLDAALTFLKKLSLAGKPFLGNKAFFFYAIFGALVILAHDLAAEFGRRDLFYFRSRFFLVRSLPYALMVIAILMIGVFDGGQFIYFNF